MKGNPIVVANLLTLLSFATTVVFISLKQRMLWKHCLERLVHSFSSCYSLLFITEKHHPAAAVTFHASTISTMFDDHQKSLQRIKRTELKFKALFRDTRYIKIKFLIYLLLSERCWEVCSIRDNEKSIWKLFFKKGYNTHKDMC